MGMVLKNWLIVFLFLSYISIVVYSQNSVFTPEEKAALESLKKEMIGKELDNYNEAFNLFDEAALILKMADQEDITLEKLFEGPSTPKAEKKAVNVKRNRIEAAKTHERAFTLLYDACESRLGRFKIIDKTQRSEYKALRDEATELNTNAIIKGDDYKYLEDKDLATFLYETLKKKINEAYTGFYTSIQKQIAAYKIYQDQVANPVVQSKPESQSNETVIPEGVIVSTTPVQEVKNEVIVEKAHYTPPIEEKKTEKTQGVVAVVEPTPAPTSTPSSETIPPKPVTETAPVTDEPIYSTPKVRKTTEVKSTPAPTPKSSTTISTTIASNETIYRIQIIAVQKGQLSEAAKRKIYDGPEVITERFEDGMYKYSIGEYKSLSQAKQVLSQIGGDAFIVAFRNNQRIPVK
ncbi:MAG: hypothetical protein SNJ71_05330 [Bacteroidales bacterium]